MPTGLGIDVGHEWIKVVQVRTSGKGVTVTGAVRIPRGETDLPLNLGQELARAGLKRTGTLGVTGREVMLKYVSTPPMPPDKLRMFIDMQVGEVLIPGAKKGAEGDGPKLTHDWRILNTTGGMKGDMVVMAAVARNEFLYGSVSSLRQSGVVARRLCPSAFGLVHAFLRTQNPPPGETVVVADIGHENIEIAILQDENVLFARSGQGGGKLFDEAIHRLLRLNPDKLKEFKHHRARLHPEGTKLKTEQELQFQKALAEGAEKIFTAVRSSFTFCRTQTKMPKLDYQRLYISGGGARLPGLREYLADKIKRPVEVLDLYSGLDLRRLDAQSAKCFEGGVTDMSVALGLAVVDAQPRACFHFDLIPAPVRKKREFWNKTVWAAAAGIVLLLSIIPPWNRSAEALQQEATRKDEFSEKADAAKAKKAAFAERKQQVRQRTQQIEYLARQTRLGPVYANFFAQLREYIPAGVTLTVVGPDGASRDLYGEALNSIEVVGIYDTTQIPDFNPVASELFKRLEEVVGVGRAKLDLNFAAEGPSPEQKRFRFTVPIAPANKPLPQPGKVEAPAAEAAPPAKK